VGRSDPHRVVQYMAADAADPAAIAEAVRAYAAAGADTIVVHPTPGDQDPMAHIRFAAQVRQLL